MKRSRPLRSLATLFNAPLLWRQSALQPLRLQYDTLLPQPSPSTRASLTSYSKKRPKGDNDPRSRMIRYYLKHPLTPRPLRFSRHRALRHWTIHRAAQLLLHKGRQAREKALEKQYNAMRDACEELRLGCGDGGRLYRQAATRKGIYGGLGEEERGAIVGNGGMPLEYARAQTETPAVGGFNEGWKRT